MIKTLLVFLLINMSICYSQIDTFSFKEGIEYFTYSGDTIIKSNFITSDSKVSDSIVIYLFSNFEYIGNNTWKTNNTITKYFKRDDKYTFTIIRDE